MANNDINITYETLFDITRREKMQEDLQKLDENFYDDLIKYMAEKKRLLDEQPQQEQNNIFAKNQKQAVQKQLDNIRKLVSELYSRRERKIINLAIIKSRTNSKLIDTSSLLYPEKSLFMFVLKVLNHAKKNVLYNLLQAQKPESLDVAVCFQLGQELKKADKELVENTPPEEPSPAVKNEASQSRAVKFLTHVPKFVGKELEVYGPYEKEDTVDLPGEIADVLIKKGRAEEVNE